MMNRTRKTGALTKGAAISRVVSSQGLQSIFGGGSTELDDEDEDDFEIFASDIDGQNLPRVDMLDSLLGDDGADMDEAEMFSSPWALAASMPALPKASDIFANRDSPDFDPRPAIAEVTQDDWEPELIPIYNVLRQMVRQAVNVNTKPGPRENALRWIFVTDSPGPHGLDFASACGVFAARPLVIQARVLHQLWVSNIPLRKALPEGAAGLPMTLASEIQARLGVEALLVARTIWRWPGIRADVLQSQMQMAYTPEVLNRVMNNLEVNGYIAMATGFWFFVSRNFETMTAAYRRAFSWGPSFVGDE